MVYAATFSITGHCDRSGMFGVAVATKVPAVGSVVPNLRPGVGAVATQAWTNPYIGIHGLSLLELGWNAEITRDALARWDPDIHRRQFAVVDRQGNSAAFTGTLAEGEKGHRVGPHYAVAGNMLTSEAVLDRMEATFVQLEDLPLPERLLAVLEAGQAAGGDKRGKQSAALKVVHKEDYAFVDLRVDEHARPVEELRRIFEVCRTELFPYALKRPTRDNLFGGFVEATGHQDDS